MFQAEKISYLDLKKTDHNPIDKSSSKILKNDGK